jgi:hypothetical protein
VGSSGFETVCKIIPKGLDRPFFNLYNIRMRLILDDYNQIYVWVSDNDENDELSPHFDYEEDAIQWYGRISKDIFEEYGITKDKK